MLHEDCNLHPRSCGFNLREREYILIRKIAKRDGYKIGFLLNKIVQEFVSRDHEFGGVVADLLPLPRPNTWNCADLAKEGTPESTPLKIPGNNL